MQERGHTPIYSLFFYCKFAFYICIFRHPYRFIYLSVYLFIHIFIHLFIYLFIYIFIHLLIYYLIYLLDFFFLLICLIIYLYIYLLIYLFITSVVDSWGKLPDGYLFGNVLILGVYEECVQSETAYISSEHENATESYRGRYCLVSYRYSLFLDIGLLGWLPHWVFPILS